MPLNMVFLTPQIGLDENPITKALLPPSRFPLFCWLLRNNKACWGVSQRFFARGRNFKNCGRARISCNN